MTSTPLDHDLLIRIDEKVTQIEAHLRTLNGQVARNTAWRLYLTGAIVFIGSILGVVVAVLTH